MEYKITEIFSSIQGEGINTGLPSIFIRFFGCDYSCSFCDSKEASDWTTGSYDIYDLDQILEIIKNSSSLVKNIVLTGGNPLIYDLTELVVKLKSMDYTIEVETQGSINKAWLSMVDLITISPKFYHKNYLNHVKNFLDNNKKKFQLKFIINVNKIYNEFYLVESILNLINQSNLNYLDQVYFHFICDGKDYKTDIYKLKYAKLYDYVLNTLKDHPLKHKCRLGLQIHKLLGVR